MRPQRLGEADWGKEPALRLQVWAELTAPRICSMTPATRTLGKQLLSHKRRSSKFEVAHAVEERD